MQTVRGHHLTARPLRGLLLTALALVSSAVGAAEPRVASVAPTAEGWQVELLGVASPEFQLDGRRVEARRVGESAGDTARWLLPAATDATSARLVVRDGKRDLVALRLGAASPADAPFDDWTIYHLMLGDFRNGDVRNDRAGMRRWVHSAYSGGDLQGVLDKVDYLEALNVNAVWLSPLFASETSHGYDVMNYYRVGDAVAVPGDRDASMALYRSTVDALHAAGIRVIIDLPLNHGSRSYERRDGDPKELKPKSTSAIQDAEKLWDSWNSGYRYWNFQDAGTREFLKDVGRYWLTEGRADGFRLDYVRGVPQDFWAEFYAAMKATKPGAFLYGEAWQDAAAPGPNAEDIATYYAPVPGIGAQFDGMLAFPMQMVATEVFARGRGSAVELEQWLQRTAALDGPQSRPVHFLDNHDLTRFLDWAPDRGHERLLAALGFIASLSSPVVIFYGTETGLGGSSAQAGFTDSGRRPMPWNSLDAKLVERVARIFAARAELPAITRGGRLPVFVDREVLVMRKRHPQGDVLVGVNLSGAERTVPIAAAVAGSSTSDWQPVLGGTVPSAGADGTLTWTLPALSTSWARQ